MVLSKPLLLHFLRGLGIAMAFVLFSKDLTLDSVLWDGKITEDTQDLLFYRLL